MSADNGVYLLITPKGEGKEYRVQEMGAVENYQWHRCSKHGSDIHFGNDGREKCDECCETSFCEHPDCHIQNAREMWKGIKVHKRKEDALLEAHKILKELYICEYGISEIKIDREF